MVTRLNKSMDEELNNMPSAWTGHKDFAHWLVKRLQPKVTVELGVDYGFSLFCLAKDNPGQVYGIDLFTGDAHAGSRESDQYEKVLDFKKRYSLDHVNIIRDSFENQVDQWSQPIDILHIDGLHTFEAVSADYNSWLPFMSKDGVILFHDTDVDFGDNFPVKRVFEQIPWPRINFTHSAGLGVVAFNTPILQEIVNAFPNQLHFDFPIKMVRE